MNDFEAAVRAHGILPKRAIVPDGRWYRCPTEDKPRSDNGAYKLAPDSRIGWYWNLRLDASPVTWRAVSGSGEVLPRSIDFAELRRQQREDRRRRMLASREARAFWESCVPLRGGHPYLEDHGLSMAGCEGLRRAHGGWPMWRDGKKVEELCLDPEGWIVVPMQRDGRVVSVQRIAVDGEKRFWPGPSTKGLSYTIDRRDATVTVLCEGLATGLAIFAACRFARVVVSFTAGNLPVVAERMDWRGNVVVAADNDHRTVCGVHAGRSGWPLPEDECGRVDRSPHTCNPGVRLAQEAARKIGCGVMVPQGMEGTDYADLRREEVERRREQAKGNHRVTEAQIEREVNALIALDVQRHATFIIPRLRQA